jgi:hypothetical protein
MDLSPKNFRRSDKPATMRRPWSAPAAWNWNRIAGLLDQFPPNECANYFRNAGYASC